jgi:hypothetical protein
MRLYEFASEPINSLADVAKTLSFLNDPFGGMASGAMDAIGSRSSGSSAISIPSNIKGGKGSVDSKEVSNYLSGKMDDNHRLGILTNIQAESGFRPGVMGDNGTSGGLFQHHNERFVALVNKLGDNWATNWKGQIDFALSEPAGMEYLSTRFSSPAEASKWWTIHFERPANMHQVADSRVGLLRNFS